MSEKCKRAKEVTWEAKFQVEDRKTGERNFIYRNYSYPNCHEQIQEIDTIVIYYFKSLTEFWERKDKKHKNWVLVKIERIEKICLYLKH